MASVRLIVVVLDRLYLKYEIQTVTMSLSTSSQDQNVFFAVLTFCYQTCRDWVDMVLLRKFGRRRAAKMLKFSILVMILTFGFYLVKLNVDTHNTHELDSATSPIFPCQRKPEEAKELNELFYDVIDILNKMNIRHFLIYGSIWGAYRSKGPLPWDYDIDIGIIGEENYAQIPKT